MIEMQLMLYAESPVHAGAADSADTVDLPIQREVTTGYPVIWGQSLKGALRQAAGDDPLVPRIFGSMLSGDAREATTAGLLAVGDAQLVAMPVPTLQHTFAWATSTLALARAERRYRALHRPVPAVPRVRADRAVAASAGWTGPDGPAGHVFGPLVVDVTGPDAHLNAWATRLGDDALGGADGPAGYFAAKLVDDLVLFGDDVLPSLLAECTETAARVQLTATKTVNNGPFYSEYLPAESILAASLTLRPGQDSDAHLTFLRGLLHDRPLQIGGDETLGKGLVWCRLLERTS